MVNKKIKEAEKYLNYFFLYKYTFTLEQKDFIMHIIYLYSFY